VVLENQRFLIVNLDNDSAGFVWSVSIGTVHVGQMQLDLLDTAQKPFQRKIKFCARKSSEGFGQNNAFGVNAQSHGLFLLENEPGFRKGRFRRFNSQGDNVYYDRFSI